MSEWHRNSSPDSQSVSLAGSTENHFSSVWQEDISYLQCPEEKTSSGNLSFWIQQRSNPDDKDIVWSQKYTKELPPTWKIFWISGRPAVMYGKVATTKNYKRDALLLWAESHPSWSCQWDSGSVVSRKIVLICTYAHPSEPLSLTKKRNWERTRWNSLQVFCVNLPWLSSHSLSEVDVP